MRTDQVRDQACWFKLHLTGYLGVPLTHQTSMMFSELKINLFQRISIRHKFKCLFVFIVQSISAGFRNNTSPV